jgi:hypothetical protein
MLFMLCVLTRAPRALRVLQRRWEHWPPPDTWRAQQRQQRAAAPAAAAAPPATAAAVPSAYFQRLRRTLLSSTQAHAWGAPPAPTRAAADAADAAALAARAEVYARRLRAVPPPRRRGSLALARRSRAELRDWATRELRALLRTDDVALLVHFALSLHAGATPTAPSTGTPCFVCTRWMLRC